MASRIAVVLGVAAYDNHDDLPACESDATAMVTLLSAADRFDEILQLDGGTPAARVKQDLEDFLRKYQQSSVDECLFYFSGHGGMVEDEFRFVLKDFDLNKANSTSISNTELDTAFRALNPSMFAKFVDACHSAVSYIKDGEALRKELEREKSRFDTCYFFFSSQQEQYSFADKNVSDFTRAILHSVGTHSTERLTYNALAGAVADSFSTRANQTPYFVHQAKMTEVFLELDDDIRRKVMALLPNPTPPVTSSAIAAPTMDLLDVVKEDAARYIVKTDAIEFLGKLKIALEAGQLSTPLNDLYEFEAHEGGIQVGEVSLAKWLSEQPQGAYFARVEERTYHTDFLGNEIDGPAGKGDLRGLSSVMMGMYRRATEITGFSLAETTDWTAIILEASPRFPNLPKWTIQVSYAIGATRLTIFGIIAHHARVGWERYRRSGDLDWIIETFTAEQLTDASIADRLQGRFSSKIKTFLEARFLAVPKGS